ncbi:peptidylprolyl isomerase [Jannaschia seohaensis]|uniref:Parvulin-like PPIase n=1 Tax=Jannaschia seohaensis TaxID=475081 RepID=A0A2Y9AGI7_9RHOB|nr:peptidylprolyl isomerase [Jannaschia seohaensis]PWJ21057.1 peptidyl-prolyl cis-trans isomerase SurA [Jannaschia seohaensis]SSA41467.1 peptidyl-prolyl cis-trans isomerase SurA [Jannaschia seohaensis]
MTNGFLRGLALALALAAAPVAAQAQGQPFAPAVIVNGQGITNWQIEQRARFWALLNAPNATFEGAREAMINETLQIQAARNAGLQLTPEELDQGMVEFAARGGLEPEQFITLLEQAGVAGETFRDFVRNGLYWRQLVQQRFGPRARPTDAEVERAVARGGSGAGGVRVLISEISIPQTPETRDEVAALTERLSEEISGQASFESAARRFSRSSSAGRGGRLEWRPLSTLPPQIASRVLALEPGEVSDPVDLGSFVGLFLLRDLDESGATTPEPISIEYAEYLIPGGRSEAALAQAARIDANTDTCDDLYGVAQGQPPEVLRREVAPVEEIPADLRAILATLDEGEVSTLLSTGGALRLVMLCGRVAEIPEDPDGALQSAGQAILNQRLEAYAQGFLDELKADAIITDG